MPDPRDNDDIDPRRAMAKLGRQHQNDPAQTGCLETDEVHRMENFTPIASLTGGAPIGLASVALLIGLGWSLVGFCPGPAPRRHYCRTALRRPLFVAAMLAGMALHRLDVER